MRAGDFPADEAFGRRPDCSTSGYAVTAPALAKRAMREAKKGALVSLDLASFEVVL